MYCRKDFMDLTATERTRLADALNTLYDQGIIAAFADQHDVFFTNGIHWASQFLPWHRHYLLRLEQALQNIDARIVLPYWDWTRNDSRFLDAGPWLSFFGGRANSGGQFDHWTYTRTQPEPAVNTLPTLATVVEELRNKNNFTEYRAIECGSHFPGHTWTGGTMNSPQSPADPIFYLHHCNIDRLWAIWQLNNPGADQYSTDVIGCDRGVTAVSLNNPMVGGATPASMLDYKALGYDYPRDFPLENEVQGEPDFPGFISGGLADIQLLTPQVVFNDVPEGDTTQRAVLFEVIGCEPVTFEVTNGPTGNFSLFEPAPFPHPAGAFHTDELRIWLMFTGGMPDTDDPGGLISVIARDEFGTQVGAWNNIPILANSIARPSVAIALVLDESGSMLSDAGNNRSRIEVLRDAAKTFVDLLYDDNGITLVSFANLAEKLTELQVAGPLASGVRNEVRDEIDDHGPPDVNPLTSIGSGLEEAADIFNTSPIESDFNIKATVVFTDGYNTIAPDVDDVAPLITERVYAVGIADAANVNNDALFALADNSEGYALVTGAISQDDEFLLEKYFIQILSGVLNREIVKDPGGWLTPGEIARVPFSITQSDINFDAIALTRSPQYTVIGLETPDGTFVDATQVPAESHRVGTHSNSFRITLPLVVNAKGHWEGQWHLLIALRLKAQKNDFKKLRSTRAVARRLAQTSLPYEAIVHARSNLKLKSGVDQSDLSPGSSIYLNANISEYGQALETHGKINVTMTRPDKTRGQIELKRQAPGEFATSMTVSQSGVYRFHLKASGLSSRGHVFTREQQFTKVIGRRPRETAARPKDCGAELCALLRCSVPKDHVIKKLEAMGLNPSQLRKCVEVLRPLCCEHSHQDKHSTICKNERCGNGDRC